MDLISSQYSCFNLIKEMLETVQIIKNFNPHETSGIAEKIKSIKKVLLTGEGSSRIFPAKNLIRKLYSSGLDMNFVTEGATQAVEYKLNDFAVFCSSNSGKTKEVITLAEKLMREGNKNVFGVTANYNTVLESKCSKTYVLKCGWENATAATKSVVEQALFYESILWNAAGTNVSGLLNDLSDKINTVLTMKIDGEIVNTVSNAGVIYFAGYNDGVAEELTLKTNEITRKKSDFLEGTYAVHGIEEVINKNDVLIIIDPIESEIDKFKKVFEEEIGINVFAISERSTPFKTIQVPDAESMNPYLYLCAGWNLLVEIGIIKGIQLDTPQRARKIGNELITNVA